MVSKWSVKIKLFFANIYTNLKELSLFTLKRISLKNNILFLFSIAFCFQNSCSQQENQVKNKATMSAIQSKTDTATFGAGCYWCVEAIFQRLNGVISVESGFSGGHIKNPSYREVCTGTTGHAEVCQITFDPNVIGYDELLEVFWKTHDPTTLNRQGNDSGTQYRSVILYHNDQQRIRASQYKEKLEKAGIWNDPIVTEIVPFVAFYKAEDYHQDYYNQNASKPYCTFVITPKIEKFEKVFHDKIKK
jgi:peptide-methionine (S)-S-oxide reductase